MVVVHISVSCVVCTTNMNDAPICSYVGDTETLSAHEFFFEQSSSKEDFHNCTPSYSVIKQAAFSFFVEASCAVFRLSRLR